ncbi:unnamed protein product [marine sediment metagenome]|uniref:t-SNARE coiled-coil homology domain-containing protein n=1 Tax=marine sediment metagenome TaxID=412755 RepID=X1C611_9ZZZZ
MIQKSFEQEMLEAIDERNKNIEAFGESMESFGKDLDEFGRAFNKGMDKLDKQADDLLKLITMPEFLKGIGMKNHEIRRVQGKIGRIKSQSSVK